MGGEEKEGGLKIKKISIKELIDMYPENEDEDQTNIAVQCQGGIIRSNVFARILLKLGYNVVTARRPNTANEGSIGLSPPQVARIIGTSITDDEKSLYSTNAVRCSPDGSRYLEDEGAYIDRIIILQDPSKRDNEFVDKITRRLEDPEGSNLEIFEVDVDEQSILRYGMDMGLDLVNLY